MIIENKALSINGHLIDVKHIGHNPLSEGSLKGLAEAVELDLKEGKTEGFYPYNNFECSIEWKVN